jgi:glutaminyl-tRNA synthetase
MRAFCERIGVAKFNSTIDIAWLEDAIREDLNERAPRVMTVLQPIKVVLTNYPEGQVEELEALNYPQKANVAGTLRVPSPESEPTPPTADGTRSVPTTLTRKVPFARELYIEADYFMEDAPKKFFRLAPGREVRLRYAYFITCNEVVKDAAGKITELRCTYDPATRGGNAPDGRKVKGTIHWVAAPQAVSAEIRVYDHLFKTEYPDDAPEGKTFLDNINPVSLTIVRDAKLEPSLAAAKPGEHFQFERLGYFFTDPVDSKPGKPVFNRTATLRDTWAKEAAKD